MDGFLLIRHFRHKVAQLQREAAKYDWKVSMDMHYEKFPSQLLTGRNENPRMAKSYWAIPGSSLASPLIALQSKDAELTTTCNWSCLTNDLRKRMTDPDPGCTDCTRMMNVTDFTFDGE